MSLPISYLEGVLHPVSEYHNPSDLDEIEKLRKQLEKTAKTLKDLVDERDTEKKEKLQAKQEMERIPSSEECRTEGDRSNNSEEIVQGSESSSQKLKRRRVRKS